MPDTATTCVPSRDVLEWLTRLFITAGLAEAAARITATAIHRTSLRGIDTHGIARVPPYALGLRNGLMNVRPIVRVENNGDIIKIQGDRATGPVVMDVAMSAALPSARERAVTTVLIDGSGHLGALGVHTLRPAEAGCIALLWQETPAAMSLPGANETAIGNNPIAFACPLAGRPPMIFDMAHSHIARGKLVERNRVGVKTIPEGWALDVHGQPTEDVVAALAGFLLPIAGPKGMGLALIGSVLAGVLASSTLPISTGPMASRSSAAGVGAFLLIINPDRIMPRDVFEDRIAKRMDHYLRASGPTGKYPGQRASQCEAERTRNGIPISDALLEELRATGTQFECPFPA